MDNIIKFWFPNDKWQKWWFSLNEEIDRDIFNNYRNLLEEVNGWVLTKNRDDYSYEELLSIIILLDQFSRNMSRIDPTINKDYYTTLALILTEEWLKRGYHKLKPFMYTGFALLPLRHTRALERVYLIIEELKEEFKDDLFFKKFANATNKQKKLIN